MKIKSKDTTKLNNPHPSKETLFAQSLTQAQLIKKINAHTRFTRQLVQTFINQTDSLICRSERTNDE